MSLDDTLRVVRSLMDITLLGIELSNKYESKDAFNELIGEWVVTQKPAFFAKYLLIGDNEE